MGTNKIHHWCAWQRCTQRARARPSRWDCRCRWNTSMESWRQSWDIPIILTRNWWEGTGSSQASGGQLSRAAGEAGKTDWYRLPPPMLPIINNLESYPKFIVALFDNNWYSWTVWIWVSCTKSATIDWESTPYYDAYVCCEQRQSIVRGVLWLECPSLWVQNFGKQNFMMAELFIFYLNAKMLTYLQPMIPHT